MHQQYLAFATMLNSIHVKKSVKDSPEDMTVRFPEISLNEMMNPIQGLQFMLCKKFYLFIIVQNICL